MDLFVNELELKIPSQIVFSTENDTPRLDELHSILEKFSTYKVPKDFAQTAALLGRLMARRKNSFRKLSGFNYIRKLNTVLCRLLRIDLVRIVDDLRSSLLFVVGPNRKREVPTRNSFLYLMVRMLGVYKIHCRIQRCCAEAAAFNIQSLQTNCFLDINLLLLAVISKIKHLSIIISNIYAEFYNKLIAYQNLLPHIESYIYLPTSVELPKNLALNTELKKECSSIKLSHHYLHKSSSLVSKCLKTRADTGMIIKREKAEKKFDIEKLQTFTDVQAFIDKEETARKNDVNNCLTKGILNYEWKGAVKVFKQKVKDGAHKKACLLFRNFLRCKIC